MRLPGLTSLHLSIFNWCLQVTTALLAAVLPVLTGALLLLISDSTGNTSTFDASAGGDPVLFQHYFWIFGHPEV